MDDDTETDEPLGGVAPWMATFADLMTLLLTFFVLLLSFATMDAIKFREALGSVKDALGVPWKHVGEFEAVATSPAQPDTNGPPVLEDRALLEELKQAIAMERLQDVIDTEISGRGVLLRISGRALYPQGEATLKEAAHSMLGRVAKLAGRSDHHIMIEGHTDNIPIQTSRFPSNWELSTARAIAAMQYLVDSGVDATRVGVAGYADLRPIRENDTDVNRAVNRRVEFVFVRETAVGDGQGAAEAEPSSEPGPVVAGPPDSRSATEAASES